MNPFDLPGPQFLVFYVAVIAAVVVALVLLRRRLEGGDPPKVSLSDACQLAYLRGGADAAVEVGLLSLLDRRILRFAGGKLEQTAPAAGDALQRPFERALFAAFAEPATPHRQRARLVAYATVSYRKPLEDLGLLAGAEALFRRVLLVGLGVGVLWLIAGIKISIALERGRTNIQFLLVLAMVGTAACMPLLSGVLTRRGRDFLALVRTLLATLPARARGLRPGGASNELALLAAVHGMQAVPAEAFPFGAPPRRRAARDERKAQTSSWGSSCGSVVMTCGAGGSGGGYTGASSCGSDAGGGGGTAGGGGCGSSGGGGCGSSCGGGGCGGCGS